VRGSRLNRLVQLPGTSHTSADPHKARAALIAILRRVAAGERSALSELYSATSAKLFGTCLRILPDRAEAEEALQEAYLTIWRNAARFEAERASPITWLVMVTRNRALDRLRGRRPLRLEPLDLANGVADPGRGADSLLEQEEEAGRLVTCLGELEQRDAAYIRAAFYEGSSYSELAARAGMPLGTIKSRIRRALLKLRECLSG
jgi:RNA polymerase sigma factor (sigma-70 family)